jgi:glycosyltransferase involved in cell wall biosynthesis
MAKISVVSPAFNEEEGITHFLRKLESELSLLASHHQIEIVIVNDGSSDQTENKVIEYNSPNVILVSLVSNSGHMAALEAGLRHATGDLIVTMDSDLQHPPSTIIHMLKVQEHTKCDVVVAIRERRNETSSVRRFFSKYFYRVLSKLTEIKFENDAGDFRLMTRRVVDIILALPENQKIFRFLVSALGFRAEKVVYYSPFRQYGESKYNFKKLVKLAISSLIGFSTAPLTAIFFGGLFIFGIGILYLLYILLSYPNSRNSQGWTSLMAIVVSLSSVQIIALGVIGRYLSQILTEIRNRPDFIVDNIYSAKKTSVRDY